MLHPSYQELIDGINKVNAENGLDPIQSRYGLVIAAAKRARALLDGTPATVDAPNPDRKLSVAVAELAAGNIAVKGSNAPDRVLIQGDGISLMGTDAQISED